MMDSSLPEMQFPRICNNSTVSNENCVCVCVCVCVRERERERVDAQM